MLRYWLVMGLAAFCCASAGSAFAENFNVLHEPATSVRDPVHAVLISIARAGHRLVAVGEHGLIIYSDDNGQNWMQAAVPVTVTLTTIAFADATNGWAAGAYGVILHTTDGGATWRLQLDGNQVNTLMLTNATNLAAANPADDNAARAMRRASILFKAGPDKPFLTVLATSPSNAMVFGAYRLCVQTSNGGQSWADCSLNVVNPVSQNVYDAILGGGNIYLVGEGGTIFRSSDGGKTFPMVGEPLGTTLFGVMTTPHNSLVTFGVAGALLRSTDMGATWSPIGLQAGAGLTDGIVTKAGAILVASEAGTVLISNDDGLDFHSSQANEGMALFGLVQSQNGDIVVVGSGGVRVLPANEIN